MTKADLKATGSPVDTVPNLDDRIGECLALVGAIQLQCWAQLDQYVMERVVPLVPYFSARTLKILSDRVDVASFDQYASLPALDQFVLRPGSAP
jgi:hypothetical protein